MSDDEVPYCDAAWHSDVDVRGTARVDWFYPEIYDAAKRDRLTIGLTHTRAADDLRVSYDAKRDGWVIEQASKFEWEEDEDPNAPNAQDWQEVAFVQAWGRDRRKS